MHIGNLPTPILPGAVNTHMPAHGVAAIGYMLGPVLGGFIVEHFSWNWIFLINVPVAILVMAAAKQWLSNSPPQTVPPLGKLGFVFCGASLALLTFGALTAPHYNGMNSLAYADIKPEDLSATTSMVSALLQLAQSFGVASGALLIHHFSLGRHYDEMPTVSIFHHIFFVLGGITVLLVLTFLRLKPKDGHQILFKEK